MINVHELNDPGHLADIAPQWHRLLAKTPGASFFHTPEWLATYWVHFGAEQQMRVLVAEEQGRVIGILPLVVRARRRRLGSLRVLAYPLDDWGSFYGPIGPDPTATLTAGLNHIRCQRRDWDLIELAWTDALGSDQGRTRSAMTDAGLKIAAERWQPCAVIDLAACGDWASYWRARTSHWRNNVRRSEKKLAARGELRYVRHRPAATECGEHESGWKLYDACERIAGASWQGTSRNGTTLSHDAIRPFLRDCHQAAAKTGAIDINLLYMDRRPVAFNYAYHFQGYVFGLRTGYDPIHAPQGAGTVLQARMIEDCFARGDHTYDLGPSYLDCKRYWQTSTRYSYRYTHFAPHVPLAQLIRAKRSVQRLLGIETSPKARGRT